jgi:hypothetical protein
MTFEQHIKNLLGEYSYQLCSLQQQLMEVIAERDALQNKLTAKENNVSSRTK